MAFTVKTDKEQFAEIGRAALQACFGNIAFIKIVEILPEPALGDQRPDMLIKLRLREIDLALVAEIRNNGQPRIAREAINQLIRFRQVLPDLYGCLLYTSPSPRD